MEVEEPAQKYIPKMNPQQFLEWERKQEDKHEYVNGEVYAMAGAGRNHNFITSNIQGEIYSHIKSSSCNIFGSDFRISVKWKDSYFYADAVIVCDEPEFDDTKIKDTLTNPVVIFEALSKDEDVIRKLMYYMQIESLKQYVMIDTQKLLVRIITKRENEGTWKLEEFENMKDEIFIEPINFKISLSDLYNGIKF